MNAYDCLVTLLSYIIHCLLFVGVYIDIDIGFWKAVKYNKFREKCHKISDILISLEHFLWNWERYFVKIFWKKFGHKGIPMDSTRRKPGKSFVRLSTAIVVFWIFFSWEIPSQIYWNFQTKLFLRNLMELCISMRFLRGSNFSILPAPIDIFSHISTRFGHRKIPNFW